MKLLFARFEKCCGLICVAYEGWRGECCNKKFVVFAKKFFEAIGKFRRAFISLDDVHKAMRTICVITRIKSAYCALRKEFYNLLIGSCRTFGRPGEMAKQCFHAHIQVN